MKAHILSLSATIAFAGLMHAGTVSTYPAADSSQNIIATQGQTVYFYTKCTNGTCSVSSTFENGDPSTDSQSDSNDITESTEFSSDAAAGVSNTCTITVTHKGSGTPAEMCTTGKGIKFHVIVPSIQIEADSSSFSNINDDSENVAVGEQIQLKTATGSLTPTAWQWTIGGTTFDHTGYNPVTDGTTAAPQALTTGLDQQTLTYYYAYAGQPQVQCQVTIGGAQYTLSDSLNVEAPTGTWTGISAGSSAVHFYYQSGKGFFGFGYYFISPASAGMTDKTTYTDPAGMSGTYAVAQIIDSRNLVASPNSYSVSITDKPLDTQFPAPGSPTDCVDSPGFTFTQGILTSASDSGQYTTYLLWKPTTANSCYVPLSSFTWSFSDSASTPPGGSITQSSGTASDTQTGTAASQLSDFPVWSDVYP